MRRFGLVLIAVCLAEDPVPACSVPVFRYALENWAPSKYEVLVLHRGDLNPDEQKSFDSLTVSAKKANAVVRAVDVNGDLDAATRRLVEAEATAPLPCLVLRYPDAGEQIPPAWTGPLSQGPSVFESPARRQLVGHLKSGFAGVVVLLLSGDAVRDRAAREFLATELPRIAGRIDLPKKTEDGPQVKWDVPVRVEFPVVEVARTPAEDVLVHILRGSEDGLKDVEGPIAFPVFGRGRALCSLHAKDLVKPSELQRSLEFLCRACSCQVKELNPGLDLLLTTDWEAAPDPPRVEPRPSTAPDAARAEVRSPPPAGYDPVEMVAGREDAPPRSRPADYVLALAAVAFLLSGLWVYRTRRRHG